MNTIVIKEIIDCGKLHGHIYTCKIRLICKLGKTTISMILLHIDLVSIANILHLATFCMYSIHVVVTV